MKHKLISLWQPYATLCVIGAKQFETRGWPTDYRGEVLIHACKKWDSSLKLFRGSIECNKAINKAGILLHFGAIIGAVTITDCYQVDKYYPEEKEAFISKDLFTSIIIINSPEYDFGDYREGRFAFKLENPRILVEPIPYKGQQGKIMTYETDKELIFK